MRTPHPTCMWSFRTIGSKLWCVEQDQDCGQSHRQTDRQTYKTDRQREHNSLSARLKKRVINWVTFIKHILWICSQCIFNLNTNEDKTITIDSDIRSCNYAQQHNIRGFYYKKKRLTSTISLWRWNNPCRKVQ